MRRARAAWFWLASAASLSACAGAPAVVRPPRAAAAESRPLVSTAAAEVARARSDYASAERQFRSLLAANGAPAVRRGLAEVLLLTGRQEEAMALLLAQPPSVELFLLRARLARSLGRLGEAVDFARSATKLPRSDVLQETLANLALGELLFEAGQDELAQETLLRVVERYSGRGFVDLPTADQRDCLAAAGRAAELLGAPIDANEAFNEAELAGPANVDLLLARARLFLENHDVSHAAEVLAEARLLAPHHPDVLVALARVELASSMAFGKVAQLAADALAVNSSHPGAHTVLGSLALRDFDLLAAEKHAADGLTTKPGDRDLLALRASIRFLADDPTGFEQVLQQLSVSRAGQAQALSVVADFAEWEHRYDDMERLLRRATRLNPADGHAHGHLGLTLLRSGSESGGLVELRRAFELDPFDVRVRNTLQLFEKTIPQNYSEERIGPFKLRIPRAEQNLLLRYVPQLLTDAHEQMVARYGLTPRAPLGIEIYATPAEFAVRTTGLPQSGIQGVCFGRKLATVSPVGAPGNLGMTLWHELAHVFHLTLSEGRVPRWLTEGLAEWETERLARGWSRELDPELWRAWQAGRLPGIGEMNWAFSHAERMEDVAVAYYASGLLAGVLADSYGTAKVREVLVTLGEKRGLPKDALTHALGQSTEQLDAGFRRVLTGRLARFRTQFVSVDTHLGVDEARAALARAPGAQGRLELAQALLAAGASREAEELLSPLAEHAENAQAAFSLVRLRVSQGDRARALLGLQQLLDAGHDGAELRLLRGRLFVAERNLEAAARELARASELDPTEARTFALLSAVLHETGDAPGELAAVRRWAALSEHEGAVHRRLLELLRAANLTEEAASVADAAIWSDLGSLATHRLAAEAFERGGQLQRAEFEWESALSCLSRPGEREEVLKEWGATLRRHGQSGRALQVEQRKLP